MVWVVADSAKRQGLCSLCWLKVPVVDWYDVGKDARLPISLAVLPAGMDDLRPGMHQWVVAAVIRDMLGEHCLDLGCRYCLSQMAFPAVARTENLDKDSCQPVRIELVDREVQYPTRDTLVLWMMKTALVDRPVALSGDTAVH